MRLPLAEISSRLAAHLSRELGDTARVDGVRALAGGASRAAISFDLVVGSGPWAGLTACVLRLDLGGKIYQTSLGRVEEAAVLRAAHAAGVPVPRAFWASEDPAILGRPFVVLERIEGETVGRRIVQLPELAGARARLPEQLGLALAGIHRVGAAGLPFLPRPSCCSPAAAALKRSRLELDRIGGSHPALEAGMRWLEAHAPACAEEVLVHGDYRLGNLIVGPEGLRAVIDWEFACAGDPHEDLAWPFVRDWRFGADSLRFAGIADGEAFIAAYEAAGGRTVNRRALAYWEVLGNFRWALGCLTQAHRHLSGEEPSVELASLGRRSAEMELEMLDLIAAFPR